MQNNPYLGIEFSEDLKWSSHISKITKKLVENTDLVLILCANMMCYDVRVCERGDNILSTKKQTVSLASSVGTCHIAQQRVDGTLISPDNRPGIQGYIQHNESRGSAGQVG